MSLKDRLAASTGTPGQGRRDVYGRFGVLENPFPPSSQTSNNPRMPTAIDEAIESRIESFLGDHKSQVVVIEGTQGVGKTNVLSHFEDEIKDALGDKDDFYVIRYLADPESSFDHTLRKLFQELGTKHFQRLSEKLHESPEHLELARAPDVRNALTNLARAEDGRREVVASAMLEWLVGLRLLKSHRETLGVQFRLDTVESKTAALRDIVEVSSAVGILSGVFLLLDELEKHDGVLGPVAVVRYLSAMRAIIDALPRHLFMMIAVTPDALIRYYNALPAFRSRLQDTMSLQGLSTPDEAWELAAFYLARAKDIAKDRNPNTQPGGNDLVTRDEVNTLFAHLLREAEQRADTHVRQRRFLHDLYLLAENKIQS